MTKIRLPVVLKLITCKITETASITKTPPTTIKSTSCLQQIATTPITPGTKNFGRVTVKPKKAETRADQCRADDS